MITLHDLKLADDTIVTIAELRHLIKKNPAITIIALVNTYDTYTFGVPVDKESFLGGLEILDNDDKITVYRTVKSLVIGD